MHHQRLLINALSSRGSDVTAQTAFDVVLDILSYLTPCPWPMLQIQNVSCTYEAALKRDVEELQAEAGKLQAELEDTLAKFDGVRQQAEEVEAEVVDEVS